MIDLGVEPQRLLQHAPGGQQHPRDPSRGTADINDTHAIVACRTQAVGHDQADVVAMRGKLTALLDEDPGIVARMGGGQVGDARHFFFHTGNLNRRPALRR